MVNKGAVLAPVETTEVEAPGLTMQQAKRLTERIRNGMEAVGMMLLEAYDKRAHQALGYDTWETYVDVEFRMSRQESYKQIDKGRVIAGIAEASGITQAKEASQFLSVRAAAVLKADVTNAAREITRDVQKGSNWDTAIKAAVAKRTPAPELSQPVQQALPAAMPAPVRRGALIDEEALLESAADLRERLKDVIVLIKKQLGAFPKRDSETLDDLHDEFRAWVVALSNFTNEGTLKAINMLRAELFEWLVSQFRDSRQEVGELAGVGEANVDYWRRELRAASGEIKTTRSSKAK